MKKIISIMLILVLALTGCSVGGVLSKKGSGNTETKTYELKDFKNISVSQVFEVSIEKSDEFSVEVTYDDNLAEYLKVKVNGDILELGMDKKYNYKNVTLKAVVKMPDIFELRGSGATETVIKEGFEFDHELKINISGASSLSGKIKTGDIKIKESGASNITLEGEGKNLSCDISGASSADLVNFIVDNADIELSGSSDSTINTDGKIKVKASGASTLEYKGDGTIESVNTSGASKVKKIK